MEKYSPSFKLILHAGISKSKSGSAITLSKKGDFLEAKKSLEEAKEELARAHEAQRELMTLEAKGEEVEVNMLLVHAQDHISGAEIYINIATEILELREEVFTLRKDMKRA